MTRNDDDYNRLFSALVTQTVRGKLVWRETARTGELTTMVGAEMSFSLQDFGHLNAKGAFVLLTACDKYGEIILKTLSESALAAAAYIHAASYTRQPRQAIAEALQLLKSL